MITIKLDGQTLYSPASCGTDQRVLSPKVSLDINANGACTFVVTPGNRLHGQIRRQKSVVTVQQDGEEIFRGRVLEDETDIHAQRSIYCEGIRGYLNDSLAAPYTYNGTVIGLFEKLIREHNAQMDEDKRFAIGDVTAVSATKTTGKVENVAYWETYREIDEKLMSAYGGYLRARMADGVPTLDWLKEPGSDDGKEIRFGVNLVDLKDKKESGEIFTILRPLGAATMDDDGSYGEALTISSVNGGRDYIVDEDAVQQYGKIWRTHSWPNEDDAQKLLERAREYMATGAELRTITLKAVDMHFLRGSADAIRIGDRVHIVTQPHGIDLTMVCAKMDVDLVNPEETTYTFGEAPRTLTDNAVQSEREISSMTGGGRGGGRGSVQNQIDGIIRWADLKVDQANSKITANAGMISDHGARMAAAGIDILGEIGQIREFAKLEIVDDLGKRMSAAGIDIKGDIANIKVFATKEVTDAMGKKVNEVYIDMYAEDGLISMKADKIDLQGYVTMEQFDATVGTSALLSVGQLTANTVTAKNSLYLGTKQLHTTQFDVITSVSFHPSYTSVKNGEGNTKLVLVEGTYLSKNKETINVVTWE